MIRIPARSTRSPYTTLSRSFSSPTASDTCAGATVVPEWDTTTQGCGNTYTEAKSWHAIKSAGNTCALQSHTITVIYPINPTIERGSDWTGASPSNQLLHSPT